MDTDSNIHQLFPDHDADPKRADLDDGNSNYGDSHYGDSNYDDPDYDDPGYEEQPPALLLDEYQRAGLVAAVEAGLAREGCDNTLRSAERWAAENGMRWPLLREQLEGNGGFCDCELMANVPLGQSEPEPD